MHSHGGRPCIDTSVRFVSIQSVSYGHTKHHVGRSSRRRRWPFNGLLTSSSGGSEIQPESAPVCNAILPSSPVFTSVQSWCHTLAFYYPCVCGSGVAPAGIGYITVVLLFAEIHGGSKTKQAAPASNGSP